MATYLLGEEVWSGFFYVGDGRAVDSSGKVLELDTMSTSPDLHATAALLLPSHNAPDDEWRKWAHEMRHSIRSIN